MIMITTPQPEAEPRFPNVSRRAFIGRSAIVGLAAVAIPALAACGASSSTSPDSNAPGATGGATSAGPSASTSDATTIPATTVQATSADTTAASTSDAGQAFANGAQMQVDFTFDATGGGRVHNPYIAVWIEDTAGDLVQTVSLWYRSDESKYLRELRRWNSKNSSTAMTTGATRLPGVFSVAWDGTDIDGNVVADGDYFVCIEAARENGPYQLIRDAVSVTGSLARTELMPSGELTSASVELAA